MKTLILLFFSFTVFAQNTPVRKLYGSFIEEGEVFNYEFTANHGVGYSLKIMPVKLKDTTTLKGVITRLKSLESKDTLKVFIQDLETLQKEADKSVLSASKILDLLEDKKPEDYKERLFADELKSIKTINVHLHKFKEHLKTIINITSNTEYRLSRFPLVPDNKIGDLKEVKIISDFVNSYNESLEELDKIIKDKEFLVMKRELDSLIIKNDSVLNVSQEVFSDLKKQVFLIKNLSNGQEYTFETPFYEFEKEVFIGVLENQLKFISEKYLNALKTQTRNNKSLLEELATRLFYTLQTRLTFEEEKPVAGVLMLTYSSVKVTLRKGVETVFNVDKVTLEFEDGVIKNIEAILYPANSVASNRELHRFRNHRPFGITGKFHPDLFHDHKLYYRIEKKEFMELRLSDLIRYYPQLRNSSENYAPENSVVVLDPKVGRTMIPLEKEKTSEILDVQVFSDLAGLRIGNPQGLIQAGISRKIELNTKHKALVKNQDINNSSWFRYITPEFVISKIDQKDQNYIYEDPEKLKSTELLRHQFVQFGAELGVYKYSIPNAQLNIQFLGSMHWAGSNILHKDSLALWKNNQNITVNNIRIFSNFWRGGLLIETKPESRWGASFKYMWPISYYLLDKERGLQTKSGKKKVGFENFSFTGFLKTSGNSKFFFRWAYNRLDNSTFFHQLQMGVQTNLQRYLEDKK